MADPASDGLVAVQLSSSGLRRSAGHINEEFLPELVGPRGRQVYGRMARNCPVIGAILFLMLNLIRSVKWRWEASSASPDDVEARDLLAEEFDNLEDPWGEIVDQALEFFVYGWAVAEQVFRLRDDGRVGWKRWTFLSQETLQEWVFDERDGRPVALVQNDPYAHLSRPSGVTVPLAKCLHFVTTSARTNPEGRSLLRNAYTSWFFRNRLQEIEAIGIERDLAGMPVMYIPAAFMSPSASPAEQQFYEMAKSLVRSIRRDEHEGLVLPSDTDANGKKKVELVLLSTGGSRQLSPNEPITRHNSNIAMTVLADFILLGHEKVGSFALSSDKTDLFATALGAYLQRVAAVINRQGALPLLALNGMPGRATLVPGDLEEGLLTETVESLTKLVGSGIITPDPTLEAWAREKLGAPKVDEEFIDAETGQASEGALGLPPGAGAGDDESAGGGARPDALDAPTLRERGGGDAGDPDA